MKKKKLAEPDYPGPCVHCGERNLPIIERGLCSRCQRRRWIRSLYPLRPEQEPSEEQLDALIARQALTLEAQNFPEKRGPRPYEPQPEPPPPRRKDHLLPILLATTGGFTRALCRADAFLNRLLPGARVLWVQQHDNAQRISIAVWRKGKTTYHHFGRRKRKRKKPWTRNWPNP